MKRAARSAMLPTTRNPWPCERCGAPIRIVSRAGRPPWLVRVLMLSALALGLAGLWRWRAIAHGPWALSVLGSS